MTDQKLVNGEYVDLSDEEQEELNALRQAALTEQPKEEIRNQIKALESQITPRRIREAVLDSESPQGWLADIESQIQQLRSQL